MTFPRTFCINQIADIGQLARHDWVVAFPWMDVAAYKAANPSGFATTYVRSDSPPQVFPWNESSLNVTYQEATNSNYPGVQEQNSVFADPEWDDAADTLHDKNGGYTDPGGGQVGTTLRMLNIARPETAALVGRLFVSYAQKHGLQGWDGVWSDNWIGPHIGNSWYAPNVDLEGDTLAAFRAKWCDGLAEIGAFLRARLPGKSVGGNGAGSWWNDPGSGYGWKGTDPDGWLKTANLTLFEGLGGQPADAFVVWAAKWLLSPDPLGRKAAFLDQGGPAGLERMRYTLALALMAGCWYGASDQGWYDEYWGGTLNRRGWLGGSSGPASQTNGVWERHFANGLTLCNTSTVGRTVKVPKGYRRLTGQQDPAVNNGATVSSVTLGPQTGLLLAKGH